MLVIESSCQPWADYMSQTLTPILAAALLSAGPILGLAEAAAALRQGTGLIVASHREGLTRSAGKLWLGGQVLTGTLEERYPSGALRSRTVYSDGLRHGVMRRWHADGRVAALRAYRQGIKIGRHQAWWDNGQPRLDVRFVAGLAHGNHRSWYRHGQPHEQRSYQNGAESGAQRSFAADGRMRANYVVRDGRRYGLLGARLCFTVRDEWS
jgi:antitoxin component YwqK of YwqJK toxin-antitoxin module